MNINYLVFLLLSHNPYPFVQSTRLDYQILIQDVDNLQELQKY